MSERKGPTESATLYKIGTKKTGNDGNKWIVSENINGIKRWKIFKKISKKSSKKTSRKTIVVKKATKRKSKMGKYPPLVYYDMPKIKQNNWDLWLELLTLKQKEYIYKIRKSYDELKKININSIEVILTLSNSNIYWGDYAWDYAGIKYPDMLEDDNSYLIYVYKLDKDLHLIEINIQHKISKKDKNNFLDFSKKYFNNHMVWSGKNKDSIHFDIL